MKYISLLFLFLCPYLYADVQPPFVIGEQKTDENFRQAYKSIDDLQNKEIIVSSWTTSSCKTGIIVFSTGTVPASTTITISSNSLGMSYICGATCGEIGSSGGDISVGSFGGLPVSFTITNSNAGDKSFTCIILAKPQ